METLPQGSGRPTVWWRIAILCFAGTTFFFSAALLGFGVASVITGAIFTIGIVDLARTKRFRWWWVAAISFGTIILGAAILFGGAVAFIIWATNVMAPHL
jgi:hypothetical protein